MTKNTKQFTTSNHVQFNLGCQVPIYHIFISTPWHMKLFYEKQACVLLLGYSESEYNLSSK